MELVLSIKSLCFERAQNILFKNFNLALNKGEFLSIIGSNGSGKTTLISILVKTIFNYKGEVVINGKISLVPQDFKNSILPWYNVKENIIFPLVLKKYSRDLIEERFDFIWSEFSEFITFEPTRKINSLSGGQTQLVTILRALVLFPDLLLLDEAFSAIDYLKTPLIRKKIKELVTSWNGSAVLISHTLEESLSFGDRYLYLPNGKIVEKETRNASLR